MKLLLSKCNICFICFGAILVSLGVLFVSILTFSGIFETKLSEALEFNPDSKAFSAWQKPEIAMDRNIYFFNWTNHEDFKKHNIKPKFVEVGPYAFKQWKENTNITWNVNKTITYTYFKRFFFDEKNSVGSLTDEIISINMVALSIAHLTNNLSLYLINKYYRTKFAAATVHTKKTVRELLFDGYLDPIIAPHTFSWFYEENNTVGNDGVFTMGTSADDNFGKLTKLNYSNRTKFYQDQCGAITGSAGELFTRNQSPTKIDLYMPEICRSVQLNFVESVSVKRIPCYKYAPGDEVFDNGTKIPSNKCYCNGKCLPYGVLNTSSCASNAPMFISLPHFYNADSSYVEALDGLSPDANKHELYIALEPKTGVIADIRARMQVNLLVEPKSSYPLFENVPTVMFPVLWFEETKLMSDELQSDLTFLVILPKFIRFISIFLIIIGVLLILFVILYVAYYKQKRSKPKITIEEMPLNSESEQ